MKNILVADDSMFMRQMLKELLPKDSFQVVGEASTGKEAITKYNQLNPDLVTMDITMPDMDGISAVKKIIEINPKAKIVMVNIWCNRIKLWGVSAYCWHSCISA